MPALLDLLLTPPVLGTGRQIRHDGASWDVDFTWDVSRWDGDLWLVVEMAVPVTSTSLWGTAVWGSATWARPAWRDVTCWVQGVEWTRGGSGGPQSQADPGELVLQLANPDGMFVPWSPNPFTDPAFMGAGTVMRVSVYDAGFPMRWFPQITAVSASWDDEDGAEAQISTVYIRGFEPMNLLARGRDYATAAAGAGDTVVQRAERILAGRWQFGYDFTAAASETSNTYQATTLESDPLSELRQLAQSFDAWVWCRPDGRLTMGKVGAALPGRAGNLVLSNSCAAVDDETHVPYVADSCITANNDEQLVTVALVQTDGGTEYTYQDPVAVDIKGWLAESYDFNYELTVQLAAGAVVGNAVITRGAHTVRPQSCELDALNGIDVIQTLIQLDVNRRVNVQKPGVRFTSARLVEMTHQLRWTDDSDQLLWRAELTFDTTTDYSWEAAA